MYDVRQAQVAGVDLDAGLFEQFAGGPGAEPLAPVELPEGRCQRPLP
ncbi:hypothetical protein ABZ916_23860 [Streptomyces sp. NPDC046853]